MEIASLIDGGASTLLASHLGDKGENQMRIRYLLGIFALASVLGAPAAMAQVFDCSNAPGGVITGGEYDGIVADRFGGDCTIVGAVIGADGVTVRNQSTFIMVASVVRGGDVTIRRTATANVLSNLMDGGQIVVRSGGITRVNRNSSVNGGGIRVVDEGEPSQWAEVSENVVTADIRVSRNLAAQVRLNVALGGSITCMNNEDLIAQGNTANGGRVVCSEDPIVPNVE